MASPVLQQSSKRVTLNPQQALRQELLRRQEAREHLIPFCQYVWPNFKVRPHRQLIAGALEMVERGEITRLMIFTPSQVGKSTLVSNFFPTWYLGRNPDKNFILASYGAGLARTHSTLARQYMMEDGYKAVFGVNSGLHPPVQLSKRSANIDHWRLEPPHRGSLKIAGISGGLTGFGASLLSIDDPVAGPDEADSEIIRQKTIDWYKQVAHTRLSHGEDGEGAIILTQTRWHDLDLAGYLLKAQAEGGELWHVLRLPALAEDDITTSEWCKSNFITPDRFLVAEMMGGAA